MTLLTPRFIPFFMIFWIIGSYSLIEILVRLLNLSLSVNVSVCVFPIEMLPRIFHYGYAIPFYNLSRAFRTITFNTKNQRKEISTPPSPRTLLTHCDSWFEFRHTDCLDFYLLYHPPARPMAGLEAGHEHGREPLVLQNHICDIDS